MIKSISTCLAMAIVSLLSLNTFAQNVDVDTFEKKIKETPNAYLLDVRTSGEFGGGHLPKAMNIDFRSPDFSAKVAQLSKDKPVLIYCLSGGRSAQAAEQMRAAGFQVTEMKGGYLKWTTRLKPLEGVPDVKHDAAWNLADFKKEIASSDAVVVDFYAKRPQVQERLTMQIVQELQIALGTDDVACVIDAKHLCVNSRGIGDIESSTVTSEFGGKFKEAQTRREFLDYIKLETKF